MKIILLLKNKKTGIYVPTSLGLVVVKGNSYFNFHSIDIFDDELQLSYSPNFEITELTEFTATKDVEK